ncbi:heterokaryon incompatibility protein-domain-containing protein [Pseudoneurospora amorphoporcata]|uniref:Heterokaryon incompatibility protein-domain-containing protein n=1 Tax=Pseudoneurospora amorphoporcata TaxID=241081 RepID=A0AAN6NUL4_9PEZI|nr:heterokaryon incompatibility protein-domain-containing protein [Pseudoneurospora amorphoporcata]
MDDSFPSPPPPAHPELSYTTIPLNTAATEIRLLELFPSADFSSPLHCRFYNTPISSPAPFKALSYAWGSDDKTHLIYCDSSTGDSNYEGSFASVANPSSDGETNVIRVTTSLDSCLRHLRAIYHSQSDHLPSPQPSSKPLTIWIDQVCIAQSDPYEKAMQVGLMSQIYSRAEQVLVWLGPEADGSGEVMDALAELEREFDSVGVNVSDAARLEELVVGFGNGGEGAGAGAGDADGSGEKKKKGRAGGNARDVEEKKSEKVAGGTAEKEIKKMWKETGSGADVREGTGTAGGSDADAPGDVVVGDLAGNLGVADAEALNGVTVVCTTDEVNASTGKTIMRVVEEGATRFARLWVSGEMPAFFRRPWFTRVWVVQEACLCADTVFVCGTKPPVNYDILGVIIICMIHAIREFERKLGYAIEWDGVSPISTDHEVAGIRMSRDATLALGGWVEQTTASYGNRYETTTSWVPDWRSGLQSPFYRDLDDNPEADGTVTGKDAFRACGPHYLADMVPTRTAGMLGLRGYLVDTIEEVGGMANREFTVSEARLHETLGFLENLDRFWELSKRKNEPIYRTPARREEALWRVPVGDMMIDWQHIGQQRANANFAPEYRKWRRTLEQYQALKLDMATPRWKDSMDEDKENEANKWVASYLGPNGGKLYDGALGYVERKSLYLTKRGYMGLGPSDIQPADVVVVCPGARIPFVLRPTSDDNTFTYLGDAYCDGIMDGEMTLREEKRNFFLV